MDSMVDKLEAMGLAANKDYLVRVSMINKAMRSKASNIICLKAFKSNEIYLHPNSDKPDLAHDDIVTRHGFDIE